MNLRVIDDAGDTHLIDLYDAIIPKASYQFKDLRTPGFSRSSYTDTFRVPATESNILFFGPLYDPTASTSYLTKKKKRAFIEVDTIPVFQGFLRLKSALVQKGRFKEFEVSLFGDLVTFSKDLGESKLSDLDFSGLDHDLTYTNVASSWGLSLKSGNVVYGFADYGARFGCTADSFRNISDPTQALLSDHLKPCVRVRQLIDAAFLKAGWTYESDHIDSSDFGKLYIPWVNHAGERMKLPGDGIEEKLFWAGMSADQTLALSSGVWTTIVGTYDESTSPYYDAGGDFSSGGIFTAPADGNYTFEVNLPISWTGSGTSPIVTCGLYNTGLLTPWYSTVEAIAPTTTVAVFNRTWTLALETGQTVQFRIQGDPSISGASNVKVEGGSGGTSDVYWIRMIDAPTVALGANIDMTLASPEGKAIDYITDLANLFNWVFDPHPEKEKHLIIEPFKDYLENGDSVDWREKLDTEMDYQITPAAEFQKKKIVLTYQKDEDFYAQQVTGSVREDGVRIYGEKVIDNSDNDFSTGQEIIGTKLLASTPLAGVSGSIMVCPKYWDSEGSPIKPKPRILYYGGSTPSSATWYMENDSGTPTAQTNFPYMGQFETFNSGLDDYDLAFGPETPFHYTAYQTYNNLFYQYWQQYLKETYSEDGRILLAWFRLTTNDIISMRFNDRVFVLGTEWRINQVLDYGIGSKDSVKVELVKILSERRCEYLPDSVDVFGEVTMIDSSGSTGAGSQECCELFGYRWDGSRCMNDKKVDLSGLPTAGIGATPPPGGVEDPPLPPSELRVLGSGGAGGWGVGTSHRLGGGDHPAEGFTVLGLGKLGWARHDGEFFIGGGFERSSQTEDSEIQARAQAGTLVLMGEGSITTIGDEVELNIQGRAPGEFNPPEDSVTACTVTVALFTDNSGTIENAENVSFQFYILNDGGTVTTSSSPVAAQASHFSLAISVSGSLVQLSIHAASTTSSDTLYASGRLDYVWARLR